MKPPSNYTPSDTVYNDLDGLYTVAITPETGLTPIIEVHHTDRTVVEQLGNTVILALNSQQDNDPLEDLF